MDTSRDRGDPGVVAARRFVWRGWPTIGSLALVVVLVIAAVSHDRYVQGVAIVLLGIVSLVWATMQSSDRMRERLRRTRGPGWLLGRVMAIAPGGGAKILFQILSIAIIALGLVAVVGG